MRTGLYAVRVDIGVCVNDCLTISLYTLYSQTEEESADHSDDNQSRQTDTQSYS